MTYPLKFIKTINVRLQKKPTKNPTNKQLSFNNQKSPLMFRFELMLLLCFSPHLFVSYSWCLSVPVCFMTEAVCRRVGDNAAFVFTTVVCALVLVLFTLSLYLPERKPETPKEPHILPEVPKPEVFVVTMAETGPTAA